MEMLFSADVATSKDVFFEISRVRCTPSFYPVYRSETAHPTSGEVHWDPLEVSLQKLCRAEADRIVKVRSSVVLQSTPQYSAVLRYTLFSLGASRQDSVLYFGRPRIYI